MPAIVAAIGHAETPRTLRSAGCFGAALSERQGRGVARAGGGADEEIGPARRGAPPGDAAQRGGAAADDEQLLLEPHRGPQHAPARHRKGAAR